MTLLARYEIGQDDIGSHVLDPFGYWFAGLADGEGHFGIGRASRGKGWHCYFVIQLRDDDQAILEEVSRRLEVGTIRTVKRQNDGKWHPLARLAVTKKAECIKLVDFFDAYPLRTKKRRDYLIWRGAVEAWYCIGQGAGADWSEIEAAHHELKATRAYVAPLPAVADARGGKPA